MIITENTDLACSSVMQILDNSTEPYRYKNYIGSNFPEDSGDVQISKIINEICINAENGISCIIRYLDDIYQTFYDLLN